MRTIDVSSSIFQPLEDAIHHQFIPALTGQVSSSPEVRKLLSLPNYLGGLNIVNPVEIAESELMASKTITTPLTKMIIEQSEQFTKPQLQSVKSALHREKCLGQFRQGLTDKRRNLSHTTKGDGVTYEPRKEHPRG